MLLSRSPWQQKWQKWQNKAPESCVDAQESNSFQVYGVLQGCTTKRACLQASTSKKLCFSSSHLLSCQTKCPSLQTKEARLIGWLVVVSLDVGIAAVFCPIVPWFLGFTSGPFCVCVCADLSKPVVMFHFLTGTYITHHDPSNSFQAQSYKPPSSWLYHSPWIYNFCYIHST
jgi:hypothetical protein